MSETSLTGRWDAAGSVPTACGHMLWSDGIQKQDKRRQSLNMTKGEWRLQRVLGSIDWIRYVSDASTLFQIARESETGTIGNAVTQRIVSVHDIEVYVQKV
jgi:hypothetical protein